jgi:transcriptional regulator with XRE-family HTH domain
MPKKRRAPEGQFAELLSRLLEGTLREDGKPYSPKDVAEALNREAGERLASPTYVWQLVTGESPNPTYRVIEGLARFFGVPAQYFFPGTGRADAEVDVALRDERVREIALGCAALSEQSLESVQRLVASARSLEGGNTR